MHCPVDLWASGPRPVGLSQPEAADMRCVATVNPCYPWRVLGVNTGIVVKRTEVETKDRLYQLYHGLK